MGGYGVGVDAVLEYYDGAESDGPGIMAKEVRAGPVLERPLGSFCAREFHCSSAFGTLAKSEATRLPFSYLNHCCT